MVLRRLLTEKKAEVAILVYIFLGRVYFFQSFEIFLDYCFRLPVPCATNQPLY